MLAAKRANDALPRKGCGTRSSSASGPLRHDRDHRRRDRGRPRADDGEPAPAAAGRGGRARADVLVVGLPYICPYNVNSIMNPILVQCLGLGYYFNLYRGKPLVRPGGAMILYHPVPWEFHQLHHPSYVDFFEEVLAETTDPAAIEAKFEQQYAQDPWYIHLYRTSHAYHGVHPFYMWYWAAHAMDHLGDVIWVGGDRRAVRAHGLPGRVDARRRAGDGRRDRRRLALASPTCTTRRT